jgi:hypothetical protein
MHIPFFTRSFAVLFCSEATLHFNLGTLLGPTNHQNNLNLWCMQSSNFELESKSI